MGLWITGNPDADSLLAGDDFALLTGMLLDQQVTMESAFAGPQKIHERIGTLDPSVIAAYDPQEFLEVFKQSPAVHRFPGSMATRVQALAAAVEGEWGGDASAIWTRGNPDGAEVLRRLQQLPGFGDQKARIFLALLGKQRGLKAQGWREAAGHYGGEGSYLSVADIVDADSLAKVRASKQAAKAAAKAEKAAKPAKK
ncbi:HhH-GPD-type base excision DNA repair protein [Pseudarthrobacter sp. J75]|uniref:HhH-GPD-type base excision DNA repair protein n=1 Tax=unclassified Pseudarthrobacter TaxID=2647000 RepID=UPI002E82191A|nr:MULTISPECIES: HhH-GPD-type base excision DNA repair protein [unclassified Pseudarthrobacter]MEE2521932.1 HhH-GPD-type base excision DNA repair protein [Pseudarthrobacter sp. J47]MEE2528857.1 HhH-GPD-type base excision DNA repair protein [Pseudarthrobacter sp. J75]MEE2569946.1 HhH-GPD-type base excision DNA repair protein [Pseudarthrobacter sp. J64]